ncbi:hypothetical protein [Geodermatophilus sp. Leaf369]|uniref:hypothetical protein n=1 Tax=Geodermatophilus sp. Leaf369 TaxID=1736354 RepID=UPI0012FC33D1|nr:hypothetical protein [Geodermatophilus sp. Leaf369]
MEVGPAGITTTLVFSDGAAAAGWEQSSQRAALLVEAVPLTEGEPVPAPPPPPVAPRWRTALVVWAGLFPFSVVYGLLVGPHVSALPIVLQSLASSAVLVPLAVFVGIPTVTVVLRRLS